MAAAFPARGGTGGLSGGDFERLGDSLGGGLGGRGGEAEAAVGATVSVTSEDLSSFVLCTMHRKAQGAQILTT